MAGCCERGPFDERAAHRAAERYRRRGLRGTARRLAALAGDVSGASVLDVGGGIGALELELLAAGAERATNVELSDAYEAEAAALLAERGLGGRVERRVADFVADGGSVGPHDVVLMHRVVCCYPDVDALIGAAAEHARRRLVLTYPQERFWVRLGVRAANLALRLSGSSFRVFVHPVERMVAVAARHGLALETRERHGLLWESAALVR